MITCPYCGKEISEEAKFCQFCGKTIAVDQEKEKASDKELDQLNTLGEKAELEEVVKALDEIKAKLNQPVDKKDVNIVVGDSPEDKSPNATFGKGMEGFGEYLKAVYRVGYNMEYDKRLKALSVGTDSAGGFLVPTEFRPILIEKALEESIVRPRATVITGIKGDSAEFPTVDDRSHAASVYGGVIGYWTAEAASKTASQPKIGQLKLEAHELVCYTEVSDKLIKFSAIAIAQFLANKLGGAIGFYEDDGYINGSGAGQPRGILTAGATITAAIVAGQATGSIVAGNISEMMNRLHPRSANDAVWIAHPYARKQLMDLAAVVGTGGQLVFMPDFKGKPTWVLAGRPILFSEKCAAMGTAGDIILADLRDYYIADFGELALAASPHVNFKYNQTVWRAVLYTDGQPAYPTALTLKDGTSSVSSFVVLDARP